MSIRANCRRAVTLILLASIILPAAGCRRIDALLHPDRCVLSDRRIHAHMAVRVAVAGGPNGEACCLRCAITYADQYRKQVKVFWVTDYTTGRHLDPRRATYVTGSDVNRCMGRPEEVSAGRPETDSIVWDRCSPSSIAFAKLKDAAAFQHVHGGRIQRFAEAVGSADVVAAH